MKAKELAKKLLENPDFEVDFGIIEPDGSKYGMGHRSFEIRIDDVGYSNKRILLGAQKENEPHCQKLEQECNSLAKQLNRSNERNGRIISALKDCVNAPKGVVPHSVYEFLPDIDF